jgi:hypothetical protein
MLQVNFEKKISIFLALPLVSGLMVAIVLKGGGVQIWGSISIEKFFSKSDFLGVILCGEHESDVRF